MTLEDQKTQAQIDALVWETARKQVLASQFDARNHVREEALRIGLEQKRIECESAGLARDAEVLTLTKMARDEKVLLADPKYSHIFNFTGSVDKSSVAATIERLSMWSHMDPGCDMSIVFNSPGGSVIDGMALFDYIRFLQAKGHRIEIIALGYAASMAGIILQAATHRVMARGAWLLIHEVAFGAGGKIGEVEDMFEFAKRLKAQAANIFVERSEGRLSHEVLTANWTRKDWWLSADEALLLGLIDEIR